LFVFVVQNSRVAPPKTADRSYDRHALIGFPPNPDYKTCDIKDPTQNITWIAPQGGNGLNSPNM
jgi:electron-transferring-flavoprotein dehydrogenase